MQWPAAEVLSRYLAHLHEEGMLAGWQEKDIVELGAGTGVLSLALASLLPAAKIIATDIEPLLPILKANIELNGMHDKIQPRVLSW